MPVRDNFSGQQSVSDKVTDVQDGHNSRENCESFGAVSESVRVIQCVKISWHRKTKVGNIIDNKKRKKIITNNQTVKIHNIRGCAKKKQLMLEQMYFVPSILPCPTWYWLVDSSKRSNTQHRASPTDLQHNCVFKLDFVRKPLQVEVKRTRQRSMMTNLSHKLRCGLQRMMNDDWVIRNEGTNEKRRTVMYRYVTCERSKPKNMSSFNLYCCQL